MRKLSVKNGLNCGRFNFITQRYLFVTKILGTEHEIRNGVINFYSYDRIKNELIKVTLPYTELSYDNGNLYMTLSIDNAKIQWVISKIELAINRIFYRTSKHNNKINSRKK